MNATRTFLITNEKFLLQPRHDYGLPFLFMFELLTRNKNDFDIIDTHTIGEMTFCCISLEIKIQFKTYTYLYITNKGHVLPNNNF